MENFLAFFIAAYCICALCYFIYTTVRFAVQTAKKTRGVLTDALARPMTSKLECAGETKVRSWCWWSFSEGGKKKRKIKGAMYTEKEGSWAALASIEKVISWKEQRYILFNDARTQSDVFFHYWSLHRSVTL